MNSGTVFLIIRLLKDTLQSTWFSSTQFWLSLSKSKPEISNFFLKMSDSKYFWLESHKVPVVTPAVRKQPWTVCKWMSWLCSSKKLHLLKQAATHRLQFPDPWSKPLHMPFTLINGFNLWPLTDYVFWLRKHRE